MTQNRSSAVMQQRAEAPDSLDDFPTPPWATRALIEFLRGLGHPLEAQSAWEPCCNRGYMVLPMREAFASVRASDVHRYPDWALAGEPELLDFVMLGPLEPESHWVFANPPFNLAEAFIDVARGAGSIGCAIFVRGAFTEGEGRYDRLYSRRPPDFELKFAERVVLLKGRLIQANAPDPFSRPEPGKPASTATSYVWLIWLRDGDGDTRARWIAPCRRRLERAGDYPVYDLAGAGDAAVPLFEGSAA